MKLAPRAAKVLRALGMGLVMQALLSAANLVVGLILIRRTNDLQYSYYILATNALLLLTSLQTSFIQPYIVEHMTRRDPAGRADLLGSLLRGNARWVPRLCGIGLLLVFAAWTAALVEAEVALLLAVALLAGCAALRREFMRVALFAMRRPFQVLQGDFIYVGLLLAGALLATLLPLPAAVAIGGMAVAALSASAVIRRGLWRVEPWNTASNEPVLSGMAAHGAWAITGAGIHWLLIQGYSYLVAALLAVRDVAALAATRLTLMPVFVLSGGVSMLLFPITARWIKEIGAPAAVRRLSLLVAGLCILALLYMLAMWLARDWIFASAFRKQFAQRDALLLMWSAVFLVTLCRDQLATFPAACGKFREMSLVTAFSALVWLAASYLTMQKIGPVGAIAGMLSGELVNLAGIIVMIRRESRSSRASCVQPRLGKEPA